MNHEYLSFPMQFFGTKVENVASTIQEELQRPNNTIK